MTRASLPLAHGTRFAIQAKTLAFMHQVTTSTVHLNSELLQIPPLCLSSFLNAHSAPIRLHSVPSPCYKPFRAQLLLPALLHAKLGIIEQTPAPEGIQ